MTRNQAAKWISVIQGFIDGKDIQYKDLSSGEWKDAGEPNWFNTSFIGEYRIKPEVVKVTYYAVINSRTNVMWATTSHKAEAVVRAANATSDNEYQRVVELEGTYER